jgi:glycosyltransferase involved in cell wall biosynthesis
MRDVMVGAGVAPDKICLDYNGVDGSVFHPRDRAAACRRLGVDPVARRLLFVGNLAPIKGPADLVHAIRLLALRGRAPELVMVGDGPLESRLRAEAEHGGIASRVRFAGRQPRDRVALWMAASDALVLPSHNEGVPNVVLEALASGRPVIATNVGGVREIHPGEAAGMLVPSRDPQLLATGIESVLARSWSEPRLAETVSEFTWHANARRVLQALDGVTAGIH